MKYDQEVEFSNLVGKTIRKIVGQKGSNELLFICSDRTVYKMLHHSDCCETVDIEDICGDLKDLVGTPVVKAEETTESNSSGLWTFYNIYTVKGSVTIRWYGESDYYSVDVDFEQLSDESVNKYFKEIFDGDFEQILEK